MNPEDLKAAYQHNLHEIMEQIAFGVCSNDLVEWSIDTQDWEVILASNDIARFPQSLKDEFKQTYVDIIFKEYDENKDSQCIVSAEAVLAVQLLKIEYGADAVDLLLDALDVDAPTFMMEYADALYDNPEYFDDELVEMVL